MVMQFEKVVKSFLDHLQIERALSENSVAAYKRDLKKFGSFLLDNNLDFATILENQIISYTVFQKTSGLSPASIKLNRR